MANNIPPIQNTNNIRIADFIRVTTQDALGVEQIYRLASTPTALTISAIDSEPFDALGALVKVGDVQRDIKSTANETSVTLVGIDTAQLGWVLTNKIKGSKIEMWHGFFDDNNELITTGGTGGLYKFFTGYINSFNITEQWFEEARLYYGIINVSASSIQIILQNRSAGRYTNNNSWQFFNPLDTSMDRVPVIQNVNYFFGKDKDPSVYRN
ncbi:hypothetical protein P19250A_0017 [Methylophilaceae phage P19250A]|nr:hypothetical protein P19250A_0017 [Methylophilaceae phage P19250A]